MLERSAFERCSKYFFQSDCKFGWQVGFASVPVADCVRRHTIPFKSSVPAHVVAGATPGYGDEVVFADGTFIDGSTSELSADGPLRPPFAVYCQGEARHCLACA